MTAEEIKRIVSIGQVLSCVYGFEVKKRMPCPIHEGTHNNFSINEKYYHCFSCGTSGDIFDLVQALNKTDFRNAKKTICEFFNLAPRNNQDTNMEFARNKREKKARQILKKIRRYQEDRICQTLRTIRSPNGDTFLEKHLENLLAKFDQKPKFYIEHDIHAHLISVLRKHAKFY